MPDQSPDSSPRPDDSQLGPIDEQMVPLVLAIGRAVLGAGALERVLLVDVLSRTGASADDRSGLSSELARLERRSAGTVLARLRELGLSEDLAVRVESCIMRRNRLVHHFMDDPEVIVALIGGGGIGELVQRVDLFSLECQQLINELAPDALGGLFGALGAGLSQMVEILDAADLTQINDPKLQAQLAALQQLGPETLMHFLRDSAGR